MWDHISHDVSFYRKSASFIKVFWPKREKKLTTKKRIPQFFGHLREGSLFCARLWKSHWPLNLIHGIGHYVPNFTWWHQMEFLGFWLKLDLKKKLTFVKNLDFLYNERNRVIVQTLLLQHCRLFFNFCFFPHNLDHHYILLMSRFFIEKKLKFFHNKQNIVHPKKNLEHGFTRGWQETFVLEKLSRASCFCFETGNTFYYLLVSNQEMRSDFWHAKETKFLFSEPEMFWFLGLQSNKNRMCFLFRNKIRKL